MVQLDNFVMMRWEAEATVVPAESRFSANTIFSTSLFFSFFLLIQMSNITFTFFHSSHFGFFAPGEIDVVQSLQETELYQEDFIGDIHKTLSMILTLSLIFSRLFLAILSFFNHLDTKQIKDTQSN